MPILATIGLIIFIVVISGFRVAQQYERALIFRFGRYTDTRGQVQGFRINKSGAQQSTFRGRARCIDG